MNKSNSSKVILYLLTSILFIYLSVSYFPNLRGVTLTLFATVLAVMSIVEFGANVFPYALLPIFIHLMYLAICYLFKDQWPMYHLIRISCIFSTSVLVIGWSYALSTPRLRISS